MARGNVLAVVGAQYGSEGKGVIVNHIANQYRIHVRVGGPNAGHSFVHKGKTYKMQVIPCGWTNPTAFVVLGRGMIIDPEILVKEIEMIEQVDPSIRDRLLIDSYAGVHENKYREIEGETKGELHQRIGSTGEGVGEARIARIRRNPTEFKQMYKVADDYGLRNNLIDTVEIINKWNDWGMNVLLEGTQGCALSLIHGQFPYVTSQDTNASQLASDVGISPRLVNQILLVARTYPIRVAGNSGPMKDEITWAEISEKLGRKIEEKTTVTGKVRRIGRWDHDLVSRAVTINRPTSMAITFLDYLNPKDEGIKDYKDLSNQSRHFLDYVEDTWRVPVSFAGTGGKDQVSIVDIRRTL